MSIFLPILFVGQVLDGLTFALFAHLAPPELLELAEQNGIAMALYAIGGTALVVGTKVGLSGWAWWRGSTGATKWGSRILRVLLPLAAMSGYLGFVFNSVAILGLVAR